jgi:hypothetical protein
MSRDTTHMSACHVCLRQFTMVCRALLRVRSPKRLSREVLE